jgi:hypothetical protein
MSMFSTIEGGLKTRLDGKLVDELLAAYQEAKRNFYIGGLRLSEVEGGRFCEAAFRVLEQVTTGRFTGLSQKVDTDGLIIRLANLPRGAHPDSVRIHVPRALRVVYDIRNNRDAAHLADGIDPNVQDATLVISNLDWVLAEFVRIYHSVPASEAQKIIENLVTRLVPAIEDFDGFLKVLKPDLRAGEYVLLLLYARGKEGAGYKEIEAWARPKMRSHLKRTLDLLVDERAWVHHANGRYCITRLGITEVERRKLHE